jgi:hypothetical protein
VEELPYPKKCPITGWYLTEEDDAMSLDKKAHPREFQETVIDARIMLMRTRIGPDVPPANKNLAVFLKYS